MKKKIIIGIIVVLVLSLVGIFYYVFSRDTRNIKYTIKYDDIGIPGSSYDVYIYDNIDIKVIKHPRCSTYECLHDDYKPKDEEYELKYNDNIKSKIEKEYIPKIFTTSNNISTNAYESSINEEIMEFIYMVINNDESKL